MIYKDIDIHLKQFIDEELYSESTEKNREKILEMAKKQYDFVKNNVKYIAQSSNHNENIIGKYSFNSVGSGFGVNYDRYYLVDPNDVPSRSEFVDYIIQAVEKVEKDVVKTFHNVMVNFIGRDERSTWYSFQKSNVKELGIENCIRHFEIGEDRWDDQFYHGSDIVLEFIQNSTLTTQSFIIVSSLVNTGGGENDSVEHIFYVTKGVSSNNNDCLIECFKDLTEVTFAKNMSNSDIRNLLGIPLNSYIDITYIPILEKEFKVSINVLSDAKDIIRDVNNGGIEYKDRYVYKSRVDNNMKSVDLLLKNNHYDIIIRKRQAKKVIDKMSLDEQEENTRSLVKDSGPAFYFFFDYETTYNPITLELEPYCWSCIKTDTNGNIIWEKVGFDESLAELLLRESFSGTSYLIGYNNSRFDNFILLNDFMSKGFFSYYTLMSNNAILSFVIKGYKCIDLCRILCMPLHRACESFGSSVKKLEFSHSIVQGYRNTNNLQEFVRNNKEFICEYVLTDSRALKELYFISRNSVKALTGQDIELSPTAASLTYEAFKKTLDIELPIVKDNLIDNLIRESMYGGRSEMRSGEYKDICAIDAVSLYPFVMINNGFPLGQPISTSVYMPNKIGIYNVKIISQPIPNIIPLRNKDGSLDWDYRDSIECSLTSVDVQCLLKYGSVLKIGYGIYWQETSFNIFDKYFNPLIEEKMKQDKLKQIRDNSYNPAIREFCKLSMNSLSGKFSQRKYDTLCSVIHDRKSFSLFKSKVDNNSIDIYPGKVCAIAKAKKLVSTWNTPTIWGSLIYSYARSYMYDMILSKIPVYGMDTDSAFISMKSLNLLDKKIFGDNFGQFRIESDNHDGILISKKCYTFFKDDKVIKMRFKGINVSRDKVWNRPDPLTDVKFIHDYYFDDNNKITVDTFRHMLKDEQTFLISSLDRGLSSKICLSLSQRFSIKSSKN